MRRITFLVTLCVIGFYAISCDKKETIEDPPDNNYWGEVSGTVMYSGMHTNALEFCRVSAVPSAKSDLVISLINQHNNAIMQNYQQPDIFELQTAIENIMLNGEYADLHGYSEYNSIYSPIGSYTMVASVSVYCYYPNEPIESLKRKVYKTFQCQKVTISFNKTTTANFSFTDITSYINQQ